METREPRAHEIAREATGCWAAIDETIPGLLETKVLREMADIGRTLAFLAPSGNLTPLGVPARTSTG
jgi:hypothetical protein